MSVKNPARFAQNSEQSAEILKSAKEKLGIVQEARILGGGVITVVLILIVLNEIMGLQIVTNATGPFASLLTTDVPQIASAGFSVLTVGFIVVAANAVLNFFGRGL